MAHRRGISDCSSLGSSGQSHETHGALSSHWNCNGRAHVLRSAWFRENTQQTSLPAARCCCSSPLAGSPAGSRVHAWLELGEKAAMRASLGRQAALKDLPAELRMWGEVSIAAGWLPSPLSRHWACFLPSCLASPVNCNRLCPARSGRTNILYIQQWVFYFVFHSFSGLK